MGWTVCSDFQSEWHSCKKDIQEWMGLQGTWTGIERFHAERTLDSAQGQPGNYHRQLLGLCE